MEQRRTVQPLRIPLPEASDDAAALIRNAVYGPVAARSDRARIAASGEGAFGTYVLIEAARRKNISVILEGFEVEYCCLYNGRAADDFALQAPYLAKVDPDGDFAAWLVEKAWGKGFTVFLRSNSSLDTLRGQFRKFTQLYDPEADRWYHFRFYSPEVVRRTLSALQPSDFAKISSGIAAFITESADRRSIYIV